MTLDVPPLAGRWVRLEPLNEAHREGLRAAAADPRIWTHMLADGAAEFDPWFDATLAEWAAGAKFPFAVRSTAGGLIGSTSYIDFHAKHKRVEIGATWYHPAEWGAAVNPECKLLLLAHAFEALGVNRVQLVTDAQNERSQAAIAKLGAAREGVLRAHMVTRGGRVRDSVVFGIVSADWPRVKAGLEARLEAATG